MRHPRRRLILGVLSAITLGCNGCTDSPGGAGQSGEAIAKRSAAPSAQDTAAINYDELMLHRTPLPAPGSPGVLGEDWALVTGETDTENRYPATVQVFAKASSPQEVARPCSGVLVTPRVILTAGNCVCWRRNVPAPGGEAQTLIDSTACAKVATITTVAYDPPGPGEGLGSRARHYDGEVRPHPALKIALDGQGNVVRSEADLALIVLKVPVKSEFPPVALAQTEVAAGESLVMVGFGHDEARGSLDGTRRSRQNPVSKLLGDGGRVIFEQPKRDLYKGDSGGPCLRVAKTGTSLVGILSRSLGQEPSFTSTHAYRTWLHEELQRIPESGGVAPP